jgi:hypothetical protein
MLNERSNTSEALFTIPTTSCTTSLTDGYINQKERQCYEPTASPQSARLWDLRMTIGNTSGTKGDVERALKHLRSAVHHTDNFVYNIANRSEQSNQKERQCYEPTASPQSARLWDLRMTIGNTSGCPSMLNERSNTSEALFTIPTTSCTTSLTDPNKAVYEQSVAMSIHRH